MNQKYLVYSYYSFAPIQDPKEEVILQKSMCQKWNLLGRMYISEEGINAQMSGKEQDALAYMEWMRSREQTKNLPFKIQEYHEHAFPKCIVKYRKQLVALDKSVDLSKRGEYLSPAQWREKLESEKDYILIDVRNDYEWEVGRFAGAELPNCSTFREFQEYANSLKERADPTKTEVLMYCTGGIRCELFSSLLKESGFERLFQLEGGVINYGEKEGSRHWLGKLFVFDDRMTVPISPEETEVIGKCSCCGAPTDMYYNCANMDCNTLFLSCISCLQEKKGCCKKECTEGARIRPYHHQQPHKPFRKWYHYGTSKQEIQCCDISTKK